jgi:hypothetical protein
MSLDQNNSTSRQAGLKPGREDIYELANDPLPHTKLTKLLFVAFRVFRRSFFESGRTKKPQFTILPNRAETVLAKPDVKL